MARQPRFVLPGQPQHIIQRGNTHNARLLGNDRFREEIETLIKRQTAPKQRGGDRKSLKYRAQSNFNRICP